MWHLCQTLSHSNTLNHLLYWIGPECLTVGRDLGETVSSVLQFDKRISQ